MTRTMKEGFTTMTNNFTALQEVLLKVVVSNQNQNQISNQKVTQDNYTDVQMNDGKIKKNVMDDMKKTKDEKAVNVDGVTHNSHVYNLAQS